jgi:pimeloyl-ACP methyl ester carboxylesterase
MALGGGGVATAYLVRSDIDNSTGLPVLKHVSIHGHDVGFRQAGEGPAILLIHGLAGSSRTWEQVMPLLARDYTVLAPDLVGHGESAKPAGDYSLGSHATTLRDFLTLLGIDRATVVGQSFGGGVAMQLAYQHPENCDRLVLVSSGGLGREVSWMLRILAAPGMEYAMPVLFPRFVREGGNSVIQFLHKAGFRNARIVEGWRAYASLTESDNQMAFVRTLRSVVDVGGQSVSAMDRLYLAARMPTMIVWGDRDTVIPVSHAYAAHDAITESRLEIIEGAGHFPHVEEPHRLVELLSDFMNTTERGGITADERRALLLTHSSLSSSAN